MFEESGLACLQTARTKLGESGFEPIAVIALDRPTVTGRMWTDGSIAQTQVQDLLATYATELSTHGVLDGTHITGAISRQLAVPAERGLAVIVAPRSSPRLAAVVRNSPGSDLMEAVAMLEQSFSRNETLEMAAALADATGASAVLIQNGVLSYASRAAFVQEGATGPFLGLSSLSRHAPEAIARLTRVATNELSGNGPSMRRETVGDYTMVCFIRRIGENNLALAASRFGLTRAELAEAESMIAGLSCKESAARLKISPETVRQRRKVIYRKLGVESCGTAVARILELELPAAGESIVNQPVASMAVNQLDPLRQNVLRNARP